MNMEQRKTLFAGLKATARTDDDLPIEAISCGQLLDPDELIHLRYAKFRAG